MEKKNNADDDDNDMLTMIMVMMMTTTAALWVNTKSNQKVYLVCILFYNIQPIKTEIETIMVLVVTTNVTQHVPCNVMTYLTTSLIYFQLMSNTGNDGLLSEPTSTWR